MCSTVCLCDGMNEGRTLLVAQRAAQLIKSLLDPLIYIDMCTKLNLYKSKDARAANKISWFLCYYIDPLTLSYTRGEYLIIIN